MSLHKLSGVAIAFGLLALATLPAHAATTTVYKCFDSRLSLVYTDTPCKEGERMDIDPGNADPLAAAKLEHARDMLDRAAAERHSDERRAAAQRDLIAMMPRAPEQQSYGDSFASPYDYGYGFYPAYVRPHMPRPHHPTRRTALQRFAPPPPYIVPRR